MTDFHPYPPLYRSRRRRRRDWWGWIIFFAAMLLLMSGCWLATIAQASMLPPRPGTVRTLPAPAGRHELRLWCRNAPHMSAATSAACRRIGGYR